MRNLIAHNHDFFVVALKDRAYLIFNNEDNNEDRVEGTGKEKIVELQSDTILSSTTSKRKPKSSEDNDNNVIDEAGDDTTDADNTIVDSFHQDSASDQKLNEITAVAIISDKNNTGIRCAVARMDKRLNIYTVAFQDLLASTSPTLIKTISSSITYITPKRVSCFTFSDIPVTGRPFSSNATMPVLISGDVGGDAWCFNLSEFGQRLLLGHTASILTDAAIIEDQNEEASSSRKCSLLLTADRDEKIRISRFPSTHVIEGYLLGHNEYVTGISIIPSSSSLLVVSCGGDMTVRLWDVRRMREICITSTCDNCSNTNEIPTAITVSECGQIVAVIFDKSNRLSLYKIFNKDTNEQNNDENLNSSTDTEKLLTLIESMECPSQPLSITFHRSKGNPSNNFDDFLTVLMGDPTYIVTYNIKHDKTFIRNSDRQQTICAPVKANNWMALIGIALKGKVLMPTTILDKDEQSNPVLNKKNETRGPAAADAPWNRVKRVEIHKEREKRKKKKN